MRCCLDIPEKSFQTVAAVSGHIKAVTRNAYAFQFTSLPERGKSHIWNKGHRNGIKRNAETESLLTAVLHPCGDSDASDRMLAYASLCQRQLHRIRAARFKGFFYQSCAFCFSALQRKARTQPFAARSLNTFIYSSELPMSVPPFPR